MNQTAAQSRSARLARELARIRAQFRAALGMRRSITINGIRYKEKTSERLSRALSRKGTGGKDYDVTFPNGQHMQIRCTGRRSFADLSGPRLLTAYERISQDVRPGMRIVALRAGTGYIGAWLSARVGPSGAVVALDHDEQAIRYAQRRYPAGNIAFEIGGYEGLSGELDEAFDAAFAVEAIRQCDDPDQVLKELWRMIRPGGRLMATAPLPTRNPAADPKQPKAFTTDDFAALIGQSCPTGEYEATTIADTYSQIIIKKPEPQQSSVA